MKENSKSRIFLVLVVWFIIALALRLINLTGKPPWTDEFSTLVFSLGNSFLNVPLNKAIAVDTLLQPLQPRATAGIADVFSHLLTESNHPPVYFVLCHWWLKLFSTQQGLVSLRGARSLAAVLGALSIPAIYGFSWIAFRSLVVSHIAAAMMAVSPFSIFLAQEARHYTLVILWVVGSFSCLLMAIDHIQTKTKLPMWLTLCWVSINALGIASHYFFVLTLFTSGGVLIFLAGRQYWQGKKEARGQGAGSRGRQGDAFLFLKSPWRQIYIVAVGTLVAGLVWLPVFFQNSYGNQLTEWIQGDKSGLAWLNPIFQALAGWITMISLLPVESSQLWVVIASGFVMIVFFIWAIPLLWRGVKVRLQEPQTHLITLVLMGLIALAIALFFIFTYFLGIDLTRGARYNFVYFPAVIVLLAASLGIYWQNSSAEMQRWGIGGKQVVALIWLMGLLSVITVVNNLGYQKYYRPDSLVQLVTNTSNQPVLIATSQKTHVQIGEMMGVAREFKLTNSSLNPLFLLAHQKQNPHTSITSLEHTLNLAPRPVDLWLVNFRAPVPLSLPQCTLDTQPLPAIDGYEYKLYHCL
ncbi:glycosyltransferase family 39 protein [Calothrix rhizosoleniae]|uniref:glycosyltransferase family 39 protein n=1 Tax=Calothrix rhizosoleniae TaxID=888997 RepID=UPI000B49A3CD|nr:glycosyltransferase [Calothrix rhizosoleniae]